MSWGSSEQTAGSSVCRLLGILRELLPRTQFTAFGVSFTLPSKLCDIGLSPLMFSTSSILGYSLLLDYFILRRHYHHLLFKIKKENYSL